MERLEAVVFDMDGVIFDTERIICALWDEVGAKHGLEGISEVIFRCIGTTNIRTREIFEEAYPQKEGYKGYDFYKSTISEEFHTTYDGGKLPVKKGVRELLTYLKEKKIKIGLATSTREAIATKELTECGLIDYFDFVTGGDRVLKSKPEPDIYLLACDNLKVNPRNSIAIEDSYNGIKSAFNAGMIPIMVPDLLPPTEEMEQKAHVIKNNLLEVKEYISSIT